MPPPSRRTFHASSQLRFLDTCFEQTYGVLNGLHTLTGLPWAVTLPLAGLGVRILLVSPLITAHNVTRRRLALQPLRHAWSYHLKNEVFRKYAASGPKVCQKALVRALAQKSKEIDNRMGTQRWKYLLQLIQFPIFLVVIETIRRISGVYDGLLGLLAKAITKAKPGDETPGQELIQDSVVPVVQSLAAEGALWFPNLLVPDPISVLPFLLSGTLLFNMYLHRRHKYETNKWGRRYLNAGMFLCLMVGPMTIQLPAAMHVYWLSTSAFAIIQNLIFQKYMPSLPPVKPCIARHKRAMLGPAKAKEESKVI